MTKELNLTGRDPNDNQKQANQTTNPENAQPESRLNQTDMAEGETSHEPQIPQPVAAQRITFSASRLRPRPIPKPKPNHQPKVPVGKRAERKKRQVSKVAKVAKVSNTRNYHKTTNIRKQYSRHQTQIVNTYNIYNSSAIIALNCWGGPGAYSLNLNVNGLNTSNTMVYDRVRQTQNYYSEYSDEQSEEDDPDSQDYDESGDSEQFEDTPDSSTNW